MKVRTIRWKNRCSAFICIFLVKNLATIMIKFDTDLFFFFLSYKTIQRSNFSALSYWIIRGPLTRSKMPVCVKSKYWKWKLDDGRRISNGFAIVRIRDQSKQNLQLLLGKFKIIPIFLPLFRYFCQKPAERSHEFLYPVKVFWEQMCKRSSKARLCQVF